jgi:hypothetical protein
VKGFSHNPQTGVTAVHHYVTKPQTEVTVGNWDITRSICLNYQKILNNDLLAKLNAFFVVYILNIPERELGMRSE